MEKLMPIEAGCMAVITRGYESGEIVTVGNYIGERENFDENHLWNIDKPVSYINNLYGYVYYSCIDESRLMRIDGNDELFKQEEKEKELSK